jgi:tetratricopeptide (TPR) repeat protein
VFADVDRQLVSLLEEANAALGEQDSPLRARVLARLAAAMQPSADPQEPIRLARDAIAMARRVGDERSLLETLRAGVAAMMDLAEPEERLPLNLEHVRLAEQLGEPTEAWRGYLRLALDRSELGELGRAGEALQHADRHASELGHPYYRWPIVALRAMHASATGEFGRAEQLHRAARELAERADDPNTARALLLQQVALLRAQERYEELLALRDELAATLRGSRYLEDLALTLRHSLPAWAGSGEELPVPPPTATFERMVQIGDAAPLEEVADIAFAHSLRDLAEMVLAASETQRGRWASQGMTGLALLSPAERSGALAAATLERWDEAVAWYHEALESARRWNARPSSARLSFELARTLQRRGAPGDRDRASHLLDVAERLAGALPMPGLLPRVAELRRATST